MKIRPRLLYLVGGKGEWLIGAAAHGHLGRLAPLGDIDLNIDTIGGGVGRYLEGVLLGVERFPFLAIR